MNILFTTSSAPVMSPFSTDEKRFPIGIGFLISVLRNTGHKVFFIDNFLEPSNFLETNFLIKNRIDYVGISTNTICYRNAFRMFHKLNRLREIGKWKGKIIAGGPHTSVALETIPEFVDYVVQGEGEKAILDVLEGKTERVVRAKRIENLDSLPMPAWDCFVNLPYDFSAPWLSEQPVFNMNTSRGCPFNCTFCSVGSIWGKQYRMFSAERIVDDIQHLVNTYGTRGIYFREDNFSLNKKRVVEFCNLLLKKGIEIKWVCETRVDSLNKDLIALMYKAGCRALDIGVESGNQRILDFLKKGITIEQTRRVFKYCNKIGMKTAASFVVGVPTETQNEREQTIKFCKEIKPSTSWFNIFVAIPKSELYRYVLEKKLYEYIDDRGLIYLNGHDELADQFYGGLATTKIPRGKDEDGFITERYFDKDFLATRSKREKLSKPKVSVIMSVYNGEKHLREAIDSILNQTLKDFEFIIVNDGSTDRTSEILQSYHDSRIKITSNKENIGLTKSLNKALKLAKGEYIARQDADDISLPERLEREVSFLDKNKDVGLLGSSWHTINTDGKKTGISKSTSGRHAVHFMCHGTTLIRKNCLEEIGLYREIFGYAQDYDLWLRIADKFEVRNISKPLYKLRVYRNSISLSKKLQQDLYASLAIEMAEERRKIGKDRLSIVDEEEAIRIVNERLRVSGIKRRKVLSHNYMTWSQAAFALDEYRKAFNYGIASLRQYMLNHQAWKIIIKVIKVKYSGNPINLIVAASKFLIRPVYKRIIEKPVSRNIPMFRKMYWYRRALNIDQEWGKERSDYALLREIIRSLKPECVLDIGCGSGRLFPLYNDLKIKEVIAQDISSKALKISKDRYHFSNIKLVNKHILDLNFSKHYFDLIISNRVLQHIPHSEVEEVIRKLTELGKKVYINEMDDSDYSGESFYMFKHNYEELFNKFDFKVTRKGLLGRQTWFLFAKKM